MNDWDLLQRWLAEQDDHAFASLVRRHLPFVYACARRQVGSFHAADVAQSVFLILARKAPTFRPDIILSSWLFRTTGYVVAQVRRRDARRARLESEVARMNTTTTEPEIHEAWRARLEPHLDAALAALSETDRRFVLTRFFERQRFAEVAERFGVSEDAAKKRVGRALERMRQVLVGRGVAIPSASLAALILQPSAEAVPPGLASTIARGVQTTAGTGLGAAGKVGELAEAALRSRIAETWRRWLLHGAVGVTGLATLFTVASALLRGSHPPPTPEPPAVATSPSTAALTDPAPPATSVPASARSLVLEVRDAATEAPVTEAEVQWSQLVGENDLRKWSTFTDSAGRTSVEVGTRSSDRVAAVISQPGFAMTGLHWRGYELNQQPEVHICRLVRGAVLMGEVRDPQGLPVAGARVTLRSDAGHPEFGYAVAERENRFNDITLTSDALGRFFTDQLYFAPVGFRSGNAEPSVALEVQHPDFAEHHQALTSIGYSTPNVVVTLQPGNTLTGRVLDPSGAPIVGAVIRGASLGERSRETTSGLLGDFELAHVGHVSAHLNANPQVRTMTTEPTSPDLAHPIRPSLAFEVVAKGYQRLIASFHPSSPSQGPLHSEFPSEHPPGHNGSARYEWVASGPSHAPRMFCRVIVEVILTPETDPARDPYQGIYDFKPPTGPIHLAGTVVDDATGEPIPRFRIASFVLGSQMRRFLGEGREGAFDWTLPDAAGLSFVPMQDSTSLQGGSQPTTNLDGLHLALEAAAEGYFPASQHAVLRDGTAPPFRFRLRKTKEVDAWVELPNTRAAVGAQVGVGGEGTTFHRDSQGNFHWQSSQPHTTTGPGGRFRLIRSSTADRLQIVHPEGCALHPLPSEPNTVIRLEPWATVEGDCVSADGAPLAETEVHLFSEPPPALGRPAGFQFRYQTRTDSQGRFTFTHVPPGRLVVSIPGEPGQGATALPCRTERGATLQVRLETSANSR
jgi:RNA polymerase sigma factor (sigma-70 family)